MKPKVYIRADGNAVIGFGHLVRSIALAQMLNDSFEIIFICKEIPGKVREELLESKLFVEEIKEETTFFNKLNSSVIVVLDGYNFDTEYQRTIKKSGCKLVCIDDIQPFHYMADAIINHTGNIKSSDFSAEPHTKFYLGPEYALLRSSFLIENKRKREIKKTEKCLICLGGSDFYNYAPKLTKMALGIKSVQEFHIVSNNINEMDYDFLKRYGKKYFFYSGLNEVQMFNLMESCDIAFTSASTVAYECCAVGIALFVGYYADNQKKLFQFLIENKLAQSLGDLNNETTQHIPEQISNQFVKMMVGDQNEIFNSNIKSNIKSIFN